MEVEVEMNPNQILLSDHDYWRPNNLTGQRGWLAAAPHNLDLVSHDLCWSDTVWLSTTMWAFKYEASDSWLLALSGKNKNLQEDWRQVRDNVRLMLNADVPCDHGLSQGQGRILWQI